MSWRWFLAGVVLGITLGPQLTTLRLGPALSSLNAWGFPLGSLWDRAEAGLLFRFRGGRPVRRTEDLVARWERGVRWEAVLVERKALLEGERVQALRASGAKLKTRLWITVSDQGFKFEEQGRRVGLSADRAWARRVAER